MNGNLFYLLRQEGEFLTTLDRSQEITFFLQNEEHRVSTNDVTPETSLNQYLREKAQLTGTKNMCFEGGCGTCVVVIVQKNPLTGQDVYLSINSCLVSIFSCHGLNVFTVEGIGDPVKGYHKIQKALALFNGTQCGFCSPGMVMNMYALWQSGKITMRDIEDSFGGNICRCTGYRPILTAFKSLSSDLDSRLIGTTPDIEDLQICPRKEREGENFQALSNTPCYFQAQQSIWIKLYTLHDLLDVFANFQESTYMLVAGNTAHGVYRRLVQPDIYIDVSSVDELTSYAFSDNRLILGANMTLTNTIDVFKNISEKYAGYAYLRKLAEHIELVAHTSVRNIGTLAGNLMTKYQYREFPSDIYLIFATVAVDLVLVGLDKKEEKINIDNFLQTDMNRKVMKRIIFSPYDVTYKYESYKIVLRAQNAHAMEHAGFLLGFDGNNVVRSARIVYGCITAAFTHAYNTERFLIGKNLFDNDTLQAIFSSLTNEIRPDDTYTDTSKEFRRQLAVALFYKYVLSIAPANRLSARNRSGGKKLERPISSGIQEYGTNKSMYPLTEPIPKIEALAQTSGQAQYIFDMPNSHNQLFAAFVVARAPTNSKIVSVDLTKALEMQGVVAYFDRKDIPGENNFMPRSASTANVVAEEVFCSGTVRYFFQPVGVMVAKSEMLARAAADMVSITYENDNNTKPLLTIRDVLKANDSTRLKLERSIVPKTRGKDIKHVVRGSFDIGWQYHYQMETQICKAIPTEGGGIDLYPSTQWMDLCQTAVANVLKIPLNRINISVKRLGGAYGSKISRNNIIATATALAAYKLNRPVSFRMTFEDNMNIVGKRYPCSCDYEVGVDEQGVIQYLEAKQYSDYGIGGNELNTDFLFDMLTRIYKIDAWHVFIYSVHTDNHAGTVCRAPGSAEGLAIVESIMDHISYTTNIDSLEIRMRNVNRPQLMKLAVELKEWAGVDNRKKEIEKFNRENRWVKRGLSVAVMTFGVTIRGNWNVTVAIYHGDGSVAVSHGGIEMGQGINTKVAQTCAFKLGLPLDKISIKAANNLVAANNESTQRSYTSEAVCGATIRACDTLLERMRPHREPLQKWEQLVQKCFLNNVNLIANGQISGGSQEVQSYEVYGVCAAEVEVDVLTGSCILQRVDLIEDAGTALSPLVDIGQVEGAFVMGLGYYTTEQLVYNLKGKLLTNRTWTYKPPGFKDIPVDFRVRLLKNNPNPLGILNTKAIAEPPLCLSCTVPLAMRNAVSSIRQEIDKTKPKWYPFDGPSTVENTFLNCLHNFKNYQL